MPKNIEIKFRVDDLGAVEQKAAAIADDGPQLLVQEDVFFHTVQGRLKLRKFADQPAELIAYHRIDSTDVRQSNWHCCPVEDPDALQKALTLTIGQGVTVRKNRVLYLVGKTRVHLDRVEQLGDFVELEVVLANGDTEQMGQSVANDLIERLGLVDAGRVSVAYADLIASKTKAV